MHATLRAELLHCATCPRLGQLSHTVELAMTKLQDNPLYRATQVTESVQDFAHNMVRLGQDIYNSDWNVFINEYWPRHLGTPEQVRTVLTLIILFFACRAVNTVYQAGNAIREMLVGIVTYMLALINTLMSHQFIQRTDLLFQLLFLLAILYFVVDGLASGTLLSMLSLMLSEFLNIIEHIARVMLGQREETIADQLLHDFNTARRNRLLVTVEDAIRIADNFYLDTLVDDRNQSDLSEELEQNAIPRPQVVLLFLGCMRMWIMALSARAENRRLQERIARDLSQRQSEISAEVTRQVMQRENEMQRQVTQGHLRQIGAMQAQLAVGQRLAQGQSPTQIQEETPHHLLSPDRLSSDFGT
jgi:hypothetical protein